jgi:hypothetical protein
LIIGSHYEYDAKKIKEAYGGKTIDTLLGPGEHMGGMTHGVGWGARNYHPGKHAGDNTDYGDGNLFVLEYLASGTSSACIRCERLSVHCGRQDIGILMHVPLTRLKQHLRSRPNI